MTEIWTKPSDGSYYFKKSHATAYAVAVVVHMNLLVEEIDELRSK
jgi:DNA polymerase III alpha subunit